MDNIDKISDLKAKIEEFCTTRDWNQFHNAKDLAIALSIEANELLELFLWKEKGEVEDLFKDTDKREKITDELADIFNLLLRISDRYDIDLSEALKKKLEKNNKKYPVEKVRGLSKKYTEY